MAPLILLLDPADTRAAWPDRPGPRRLLILDEGPAAAALRSGADAEAPGVPLTGEAGETFARDYADFIAALSRANASPLWWGLTLPGKNPVASRLPRRCRAWTLAAGEIEALHEGVLVVICADPIVGAEILALARRAGYDAAATPRSARGWKAAVNRLLPTGPLLGFLRALAAHACVRAALDWRPEPGARYALMATLLNHQSFGPDGRYRDTYFGDLPARLAAAGRRPLVLGPITADFARTLRRLALIEDHPPVIPWEYFLGPRALARVLARALSVRLFGPAPRGAMVFRGRNVSPLVAAELREDAASSRLFSNLGFDAAMRAALRVLPAESLHYPFENRAWERMLLLAFRQALPVAPVVGYQHASLTPNHLNFVLGADETALLPLPDRIATLGEITRETMIRRGFPAALLETACALRQAPAPAPRRGPCAAKRVLVTLATSPAEYAAALSLLDAAFADSGPEIRLRPHPEFPLSAGLSLSGPVRFTYADDAGRPLDESFAWADAVVYVSSTLGLEAVRRGLPVVRLELDDFLSTDPLEGFDVLRWTARDGAGLRAALAAVAALGEAELDGRRAEARAYAERYFRPVDERGLEPLIRATCDKRAPAGAHR